MLIRYEDMYFSIDYVFISRRHFRKTLRLMINIDAAIIAIISMGLLHYRYIDTLITTKYRRHYIITDAK